MKSKGGEEMERKRESGERKWRGRQEKISKKEKKNAKFESTWHNLFSLLYISATDCKLDHYVKALGKSLFLDLSRKKRAQAAEKETARVGDPFGSQR